MEENSVKTQKFIIKYFTEIMIKGETAKRQMINQLFFNLQRISNNISSDIKIKKFFDKIELVCPSEFSDNLREKLLETPGIQQVLEAIQIDNMHTLDEIKVEVNKHMAKTIEDKTFVVRAKRVGKQDFKSTHIEQTVGGYMLAHNKTKGVDLKNPEVTIKVELEHAQLNIITKKHYGLGGFPLGTQGEVLSLMSGGFDSTVASYLAMKRGLKTHFVFFNLGGVAHEIGVKQVSWYLWNKFGSSHRVSFITVPFEDVVSQIFKDISAPYMGVMLKRLMLLASEKIAQNLNVDALITGESVAQVSSQTLKNLRLIDDVSNILVLRPLSFMSKPDIIEIASKIGTKRFAEAMPEYCGVISQHPVTNGSFTRVEKESKAFDYSVLEEAIKNAKVKNIDEVLDDVCKVGTLEVVNNLNESDIIIDIRQSSDTLNAPCKVLKIPFYDLKKEFKKLEQDKTYLLYCDKGVMSQLHGQYLKDEHKFENIKVYRPK
ncbi:tRNA uracil 4-sulfurtransferase ThiI [Aliarcobacter cibarius]|jgi:tRNA uracil 4-sulfurtransferase|uniref:Probable tRNA sulfurtransferase n=1 Tax=Aliarcobacter cibarius TaxID=255507 RepID=A0A5J6RG73_9BACT|nr:tRNA uracil 4-sulfurtransferase ThiI [Aliarcobacter cibarius]QEZ88914.1 tRNA uridine 4-sulfurtransferase [Aliarcobacter cibarius]QKJ26958.1 tRNA uridine 4-sulfurtransferase [Aliarcobacter cibarius]TLS97764.1 tRNA 4-thiouridine(8) synthase ThiI [Aliarcobacter cibarius]TLS98536.1 tRNA 4-thiouridine(8) synthase ThiI [Aliarcobacter cibarius]